MGLGGDFFGEFVGLGLSAHGAGTEEGAVGGRGEAAREFVEELAEKGEGAGEEMPRGAIEAGAVDGPELLAGS